MRTHEYVYAISTDNIRTAIAQAEDALSDLLEERVRTSENESELPFSLELLNVLARHREQRSLDTGAASSESEDDDDAGAFEIVD